MQQESIFSALVTFIHNMYSASFMPVFYFLSGYTYKAHPHNISSRFKRILPHYFSWGTLCLIITWGFLYITGELASGFSVPLLGLLYSRCSIYPAGSELFQPIWPIDAAPLWFLTSLLTSYVLFSIIQKTPYRKLIIICYVILTWALSFCPILLPWSIDTAFAGALFIYAGNQAKETNLFSSDKMRLQRIFLLILPLYIAVAQLNGPLNMSVRQYGTFQTFSPIIFLLIGITGSIVYCGISQVLEKTKLATSMTQLGKKSLLLLCSHSLCFHAIDCIFPKTEAYTPILSIVKIITAIFFAFTFDKLIDITTKKRQAITS